MVLDLVPRGSQKLPKRWDIGCHQPIASWGLLRGETQREDPAMGLPNTSSSSWPHGCPQKWGMELRYPKGRPGILGVPLAFLFPWHWGPVGSRRGLGGGPWLMARGLSAPRDIPRLGTVSTGVGGTAGWGRGTAGWGNTWMGAGMQPNVQS